VFLNRCEPEVVIKSGGGVGEVVEKVPEKGAEREGKRVDRQPLAMDKLT